MRIYWYRPFSFQAIDPLALAVVRDGDELTVQSIRRQQHEGLARPAGAYTSLRDLPDVPDRAEGSLVWLGSRVPVYVRRAWKRHRQVRRGAYDVAHVFSLNVFTDPWALRALRRRVALVSTVHDVVPHEARLPVAFERRQLARMYRHGGTLVVAHEVLRDRLVEQFDVPHERVRVVPLPVRAVPDPPAQEPDGEPVVLFFGSFRRNKGIPVLLDAIGRLRSVSGVRFVFAGAGAAELEQRVAQAAVADRPIRAEIGKVPDERKDELYRAATLVVMPYTEFASQSGVLGDAFTYRVPVIATDVGALGPTVRQEEVGWVVPPRDAEALAATLERALGDRAARQRVRERMAVLAGARGYPEIGRALRALYADVAAY